MKLHDFKLVGGDTDGLAFKKADEKPFTNEERAELVNELNSYMDEMVRWEDDGVFKRQVVVRAKNYVLQYMDGTLKIKGNSLKAPMKEKALQRFLREIIDVLLKGHKDQIFSIYMKYAKSILEITDITEWCVKKTVTKSVLNSTTVYSGRVLEALEDSDFNEGDKVYMFNREDKELALREDFDGVYNADKLLEKLYDTLCVFDLIIDISLFPNFTLKRNREMLGLEAKTKPKVIKGGYAPAPQQIITREASS